MIVKTYEEMFGSKLTVGDICKGFVYDKNEGKGLFGLDGQLVVQPEFQASAVEK